MRMRLANQCLLACRWSNVGFLFKKEIDISLSCHRSVWGFLYKVVNIVKTFCCSLSGNLFRMEDTLNDGERRGEKDQEMSIDTSQEFGATLSSIDTNTIKMATVLQQIYEHQCSTDGPPGHERDNSLLPPANCSEASVNAKALGGHSSRQNDDDRVSLYASGDEQDDLNTDLQQLTGQTRQNSEVNDHADSTILQDLANQLEEDEPIGPSINQSLADIAKKRWGEQLGPDKVKALLAKYKRPENCGDITETRVNTEIWNQLSAQKKKTDLQLSNIQQTTRKLLFANLQITNMLMEANQSIDTKSLLAQAVDSVDQQFVPVEKRPNSPSS